MVPTREALDSALSSWYRDVKAAASPSREYAKIVLTDGERRLLRYGRKFVGLVELGPVWGPKVGLYRAVGGRPAAWATDFVRHAGVWDTDDPSVHLKRLTGIVTKYKELFHPNWWMWCINLELWGGAPRPLSPDEMSSEVRDWVQNGFEPSVFGSKDQFLAMFSDSLEAEFNSSISLQAVGRTLTLKEFASSITNWAGPGSSSYRDVPVVTEDGIELHVARTKNATALVLSPPLIEETLRGGRLPAGDARAFTKLEAGKPLGRVLIAGSFWRYIAQSYLYQFVILALSNNKHSPLFMTSEEHLGMWEKLTDPASGGVHVPVDQSRFDRHISLRMLERVYSWLYTLVQRFAPPGCKRDLLHVWQLVYDDVFKRTNYVLVGNERVEVTGGLMSGEKFTALFGLLCNIGIKSVAARVCAMGGLPITFDSFYAFGDDDEFTVPTFRQGCGLMVAYEHMGFEVSATKTSMSRVTDDFLRMFTSVDQRGLRKVRGIPARCVNAIIIGKPWAEPVLPGGERARELVSTWFVAASRGFDVEAVWEHCARDISGSLGIDKSVVTDWLHTPSSFGGGGVTPFGDRWVELSEPRVTRGSLRIRAPAMPWYLSEMSKLGLEPNTAIVDKEAVAMLKLSGGKPEVVPSTWRYIEPVKPWLALGRRGKTPLAARPSRSLVGLNSGVYLEVAIADRRLSWIRDVWLDQSLRTLSDTIESRAGRAVWYAWLRGKLPFGVPRVVPFGGLQTSVIHRSLASVSFADVLFRQRVTMSMVRRAALTAEYRCETALEQYPVSVGA